MKKKLANIIILSALIFFSLDYKVYASNKIKLCEEPNFLRLLMLIKTIVSIAMIVAVIVLIISSMITLTKTIINDKYELPKALDNLKNKFIISVILLLSPTLINWIFFTDNFITSKVDMLKTCVENLSEERIAELEELKKKEEEAIFVKPSPSSGTSTSGKDSSGTSYASYDTSFNLSSGDLNVYNYVEMWEGSTGSCSSGNGYIAKAIGDGTVTAGPGVTNYKTEVAKALGYGALFPMSVGDCVSKVAIDSIKNYTIENETNKILNLAKEMKLDLKPNQIMAITDISYNSGFTTAQKVLAAYTTSDASFKEKVKELAMWGKNNGWDGVFTRRDADYELFVEGVTDNVKKGYSRKIKYFGT